MASNVNTIVLKGKGHHDEGEAGAAISPGEAIRIQSDGTYDPESQSPPDATTGHRGLYIAKEDALQGKTVDDAYASGDTVFFYTPLPGDVCQILVKSGEDIDVGDEIYVEGAGSGLFIESTTATDHAQFEALEDSGGALAANTLLRARKL
mgnify:CR=1 FL=1